MTPPEFDLTDIDLSRFTPEERIVLEVYLEKKALQKKGESFLDYVQHIAPWVVIEEVHVLLARHFEKLRAGEIDRLMVMMPPRTGKLCADSTPVLTPRGWRTHGELCVGDEVFHPSGKAVKVVAVGEPAAAEFEVEFSNREVVKCHGAHEWTVWDRSRAAWRVLETQWFVGVSVRGQQRKLWQNEKRARYAVPDICGMEFSEQKLPLDPYVLGTWLGDGSTGKPCLTMTFGDLDYVLPRYAAAGFKVGKTHVHLTSGLPTVAFTPEGQRGAVKSEFAEALTSTGVYYSKAIPAVYLQASRAQRLQLLAGLVDTDGHTEEATGRIFVSTCSVDLRDGIFDLCTTLGFRPYIVVDAPRLSTSGIQGKKDTYKIFCQPTEAIPVAIPRKQVRVFALRRRVAIVDVRRTAIPEQGKCIQVAAEDGLYVVGRQLVPTHNSLFTSELLPSWWEGHYANDKILHASYASTLVEKFGRKIRNHIMDPSYQEIFPETQITKDSRAASQWATTKGGEYNAVGVGGGVAGKGGNLMLIDDPMSEQDMFSKTIMESIYQWHGSGWYTRRQPDRNAMLLTMCMTGDTPVMMADGTEKQLRAIRPGDAVATYEKGQLATTTVLDHRSSGVDSIFTLRTRSGRILRANERHPFLVETEGERKWMRLRELRVGDNLVVLKGASDMRAQTPLQDYAQRASQGIVTEGKTQMLYSTLSGITGSGKGSLARMKGAQNRLRLKGIAAATTIKLSGLLDTGLRHTTQRIDAPCGSNTDTGLRRKILTSCSKLKMVFARFVDNLLPSTIPGRTGTVSYASITATTPMRYGGYCATTATSQLGMPRPQPQQMPSQSIYDFTTDEVLEIVPSGQEEVFDVEIARTENFLANGVVSHNTRWAVGDLVGRLLADAVTIPGADQWVELKIPAIVDQETADLLNDCSNDPHITAPHFYKPGESFSPRRWPLQELLRTKNTITRKAWASLYMQSPVEDEGGILQRDWWKAWKKSAEMPAIEYILQSYDTAFEEGESNDYSARVTWGVFKRLSDNRMCAMVLERMKRRLNFPDLLEDAMLAYKEYKPDRIVIEKAASGHPLYQEMRKRGIPVTPVPPKGSKISRANAATILLEQGVIYYPDGRAWADELIEECASFPNGLHDDLVDATVYGLLFLRRLFMLETPEDEDPDEDETTEKPIVRSYARRQSRMRIAA